MDNFRLALRVVAIMIIVMTIVKIWMNVASKVKITEFLHELWSKLTKQNTN